MMVLLARAMVTERWFSMTRLDEAEGCGLSAWVLAWVTGSSEEMGVKGR